MNTVYKIIPVSLYDIVGLETWLNKQASLGLRPTHLGSYASFKKDGITATFYHIVPKSISRKDASSEQKIPFSESGWEYALPLGNLYDVYFSTDPEPSDVCSDYEKQGQALDSMAKAVKRGGISSVLVLLFPIILLLVAFLLPNSRFDVQPNRMGDIGRILFTFTDPKFLLFLMTMLWSAMGEYRERTLFLKNHKALKKGLPPFPSKGEQKRIVWRNALQLLLLPLLIFALLGGMMSKETSLAEFSQPYIALAEIEQVPLYTYEELFGADDALRTSDENYAKKESFVLATSWYEVVQNRYEKPDGTPIKGFSPDRKDGLIYSPNLDMTKFSLIIPQLSRWVAKMQLAEYRLVNLHWEYEEVDYPNTDFVILATTPNRGIWQMAAVGRRGEVAVFRYGGEESLENHLDTLIQMVQ